MAVSFQLLRSSTASKRPTAANLAAGELGLNFNDDTSGLFYENASGNIMKVGPAEVGSTAPNASPASGGSSGNSKGELWYDTGNSILKVYNGSSFVASADVTTITGVTAGTVSASKAVIVDADKDVTGFRNITLTGELDAATLDISGDADIDGVLNADAVDIDGNTNMGGNLTFSGGATNMVLTDNTAGALDIKEGTTSYLKFDTTNGSELITAAKDVTLEGDLEFTSTAAHIKIPDNDASALDIAEGNAQYVRFVTTDGSEAVRVDKALDINAAVDFAADLTFSTAQDFKVIDNSGLALRIMESTNEYLRIITTDGSESVTIAKTLETNGDLQLDGGLTAAAETNINLADNTGYALRFIEGTNEYLRFRTTDGDEEIDCSVAVNLDGAVTLNNNLTITGDRDITIDSGTSNAIDFVISGGNRMMRFNTNTETVLLEQNFEVDGTATFDGAMDIDSTMDISGGDITLSANCDIHIPDNSAQALDIAEAGNNYVRFITTDDAEEIEISKKIDCNAELHISEDIYFDNATAHQFHLPISQQYALEIRNSNSPMLTFDSRGGTNPGLQATSQMAFNMTTTPQTLGNSQLHFGLVSDTELRISVKGSDGTLRTATLTLS